MLYKVWKDRSGIWRWILETEDGKALASTLDGAGSKDECMAEIAMVQSSQTARIEVQHYPAGSGGG